MLDDAFGALANSTRRAIVARLASGEATVTELAAPFKMSLPAISKHIAVLESAGLVRRRKEGRVQHCRLRARPLRDINAWTARYRIFWEAQFDSLDRYLAAQNPEEDKP